MILEVILFLAGITLLIKGADLFVGGGGGLAARFGVSPAIIGFTVIAFGTSLPEFVVSVNAVIANDTGIALGNVLGSNIANIALVLALCAFIRPALVSGGMANLRETALMLAATGVFCLCALRGVLDLPAGLVMLATFAVPLLAGLYWRGATREGALASMALGLVAALLFGFLNYFKVVVLGIDFAKIPLHFSAYAFIISIIAMIVVSLLSKKTDEKILDETLTGWYISKD